MSRKMNQKLKILYLKQILQEQTDDEHSLTMEQIIKELNKYGISAERKSVYADIDMLRLYGIDIIGEKRNKNFYYHIGERKFELAELKLLVDAVQSSKFITEKKSNTLIKKLEDFLSKYEAKKLQRQVFVSGRIKMMNESIYYNVDRIHEAIASNEKIMFQYYKWDVDKNIVLRHGGDYFCVSPWGLLWNNENYYLVAYDSLVKKIKHYRVDKMLNIDLIEEKREGKEYFEEYDLAKYTQRHFGMFSGREEKIKIQFKNELAGVVLDRFGKDTVMQKIDENYFVINVTVVVSKQFLGWIFALDDGAKIVEPDDVVVQMKEHLLKEIDMYKCRK